MSIKALCQPRAAADRRATVLSLETFLKRQVDGSQFFDENFFTTRMLTLVDRAFRHLTGARAGSSIFLRSQAMGVGKTHSMIALGFLARDPKLRIQSCGKACSVTKTPLRNLVPAAWLVSMEEALMHVAGYGGRSPSN